MYLYLTTLSGLVNKIILSSSTQTLLVQFWLNITQKHVLYIIIILHQCHDHFE